MKGLLKRIQYVLLTLCVVSLLASCGNQPDNLHASMGLGAECINNTLLTNGAAVVEFGTLPFSGEVITWRVLTTEHDFDESAAGNQRALFMVSTHALDTVRFGENGVWQESDAKQWCTSFAAEAFSPVEYAVIAETVKAERNFEVYGNEAIDRETVFFLSAAETQDRSLGFLGDADRATTLLGKSEAPVYWWLRSSVKGDDLRSWCRSGVGTPSVSYTGMRFGARPALNIDASKILFTRLLDRPSHESFLPNGSRLPSILQSSSGRIGLTVFDDTLAPPQLVSVEVNGDTVTLTVSFERAENGMVLSAFTTDEKFSSLRHYASLSSLESQQRETTLSFGLPAEYYSEDLSLWLVLETAQDTSTIRASQPILITGIGHG